MKRLIIVLMMIIIIFTPAACVRKQDTEKPAGKSDPRAGQNEAGASDTTGVPEEDNTVITAENYFDKAEQIAEGYLNERTETNFDIAVSYKMGNDDVALFKDCISEIEIEEGEHNIDKDPFQYLIHFFNEAGDLLYLWVVTSDREIITENRWKLNGEKLYEWLDKIEEQGKAQLD